MRTLRTTWAAAWFLALVAPMATAADDLTTQLLTFRPSLKGVEYELPADPVALAACKGEEIPGGYQLRDGQGKILCRLMYRNKPKKIDQWSYYQDGFEVYRELDNNGDLSIDEARWMNAAGTRVAKVTNVNKKAKIVGWTRISAEESSKILVQALVSGDSELLETVMTTPAELEALGIPKGEVDAVAQAEKQRVAQISAMRPQLVGWDAKTTFMGLSGAMPHLIPADAGLKDDVILCESATIFAGSPAQPNPSKMAFLQVGEMIKIGEAWKFVDLPRVIDPNKAGPIAAVEGGIRSWVYRADAANPGAGDNSQVALAMQALAAYDSDKTNQALLNGGEKEQARYHVGRVGPLNKIVRAAAEAGDPKIELDHSKLIVDSLAAAYATGQYQPAVKLLDDMAKKGDKVATYAAYKKIEADFALQNAINPGNPAVAQEAWMANLQSFAEKNPRCEEAPPAMMLLASSFEMNGRETDARKWYAGLAKDHPDSDWGKKAAGALRRLDIVGKPIALKGADLRGKSIDTAQYSGKTLLVTFWATWANPAKRDMPELAKLQAKFKSKGFEVIAINLDNDKADVDAFLQANPLPWPEIFEPGGMENRLATEFGIISLPTMFLVDADGKVVNRSLRSAAELEVVLEKMLTGKVALGGAK